MATPRPTALALTYEDYLGFPDDGKRHEILAGEHVMTPAPNLEHQAIVANLLHAWMSYGERRAVGSFWSAPVDVILSRSNVIQPDLCFVANGGAATLTRRGIEGPPDIVVEVLSPATSQRDAVTKRHLYAQYGVGEYWIIDPEARSLRILQWSEAGYRLDDEQLLGAGDTVRSRSLPGFAVELAALLRSPL